MAIGGASSDAIFVAVPTTVSSLPNEDIVRRGERDGKIRGWKTGK